MRDLKANPIYFGLIILAGLCFLMAFENIEDSFLFWFFIASCFVFFSISFFIEIKLPAKEKVNFLDIFKPFKIEKTLLYVRDEEIQKYILKEFEILVPLYMVFCTKDKIVNSSLWFEMWSDKEYINK